jgi:hypothetical protein
LENNQTDKKKVHNDTEGYKKTSVQDTLLTSLFESKSELLNGTIKFTEKGGDDDKNKSIDAYVNGTISWQVKMDFRSMLSGSTALEIAQLKLNTKADNGFHMFPPIEGGISKASLMDVDFIVYILPGEGISIWKPTNLSRLAFHLMRDIPMNFEANNLENRKGYGEPIHAENAFKIGVAPNTGKDTGNQWNTLNYIIPNDYMMREIEIGQWEIEYGTGIPKFYGTGQMIKPAKTIEWGEVLMDLRYDLDALNELQQYFIEYTYNRKFGAKKARIIADTWDIPFDSMQLWDHSQ